MPERPRFLVLSDALGAGPWLGRLGQEGVIDQAGSWDEAVRVLRGGREDVLIAAGHGPGVEDLEGLVRARQVLAAIPDGAALVDFDLKVRWANAAFEAWCDGPPVGRGFYEALGSPDIVGPEFCPFHSALASLPLSSDPLSKPAPTTSVRLQCRGSRWIDLHITPLRSADGPLLVVLGRDVTPLVLQRHKLDALHKAGRELAAIPCEQLAEMSVAERVELLKHNIRQSIRDILHYEVIEVRLLDPKTGRLEPLMQEGMTPGAASRVLEASTEGNGVTGWVAATGKSYLCPDTTADPIYLTGAQGAHSSLTVPLVHRDRVIGTFNVESPRAGAFGEEDLQFAEEFSHEVATALKTLELLSVEKSTTASQSIEAISREVALPVDDILAAATSVLDRYIGHDAEMADKLRHIIAGARAIKEVIQKVGEDIAPAPPAPADQPAPPPSLKGMRVLVADNDDRVRRSAHRLLGRWGCVVETARDGVEALTMARLSGYDAIVTDIFLPEMHGHAAYCQFTGAQPRARVILMTGFGYDPEHNIVKARQAGLRWVLYKPFRVDQLLSALTGPEPPSKASASDGVGVGADGKDRSGPRSAKPAGDRHAGP